MQVLHFCPNNEEKPGITCLTHHLQACIDRNFLNKEFWPFGVLIQALDNIISKKSNYFGGSLLRAGDTQAENSAKFGQNGLCMLGAIS